MSLETDPGVSPKRIRRLLRRRIRTNNMIERLNREIRRRTRVVGSFPDGRSALMLICARVRYVTSSEWSTRRYLDMSRLGENVQSAD